MILTREGPASSELVTLNQAKAHLRVDGGDDDTYIASLIAAAIAHLDGPRGVLGRCVQRQRWRLGMRDGWDFDLKLPLPHAEDVSAAVVDGGGDEEALAIEVRDCGPWSVVRPVEAVAQPAAVVFTAGVPDDILPSLRMAALLIVGNWYLNREEVVVGATATALPLSAARILAPIKIRWVA